MASEDLQPESVQSRASFEKILQASSLPSSGPEYYAARRRIWLTPRVTPPPPPPSVSRQKLEELFSQPGAVYSQDTWNNGLEKVWKGLSSGGRLKYNLPMTIIIKIIHAAWLRDRTWPAGMEAADTDEQLQAETAADVEGSTSASPLHSTQATTFSPSDLMEPIPPWMTIDRSR